MASMSQRAQIYAVLEAKGFITNADFQAIGGLTHTGRNRITDEPARTYFGAKRKYVEFDKSTTGLPFLQHRWDLKDIPPAPAFGETTSNLCEQCGHVFQARTRDVKNGLGRVCGPQCAGRLGGLKTQASRKETQASRQLEMTEAT
jgi:hypothetical protein